MPCRTVGTTHLQWHSTVQQVHMRSSSRHLGKTALQLWPLAHTILQRRQQLRACRHARRDHSQAQLALSILHRQLHRQSCQQCQSRPRLPRTHMFGSAARQHTCCTAAVLRTSLLPYCAPVTSMTTVSSSMGSTLTRSRWVTSPAGWMRSVGAEAWGNLGARSQAGASVTCGQLACAQVSSPHLFAVPVLVRQGVFECLPDRSVPALSSATSA